MKSLREFFLQVEADETATATKPAKKAGKSKNKEGDKPKSKAAPASKKASPKKKEPEKKAEPEKKTPSLTQLAKSAMADEPKAKTDKPSDDFPDFGDKDDKEPHGNPDFQNDPPKKREPNKNTPSLKNLAKSATSDKPYSDLPTFRKKQKEPDFGHPDFNDPDEVDDDDIYQNVDDDDLEPDDHKKGFNSDMAAIRKDKQKAKDSSAKDKADADTLKKLQNTPKPPALPNNKLPSLSTLAKRDTPQDPKDPFADFPKFPDKDPNAEDPFAQSKAPSMSPPPAKKGFLQKGADMLKKAGSAALDKGMAYGGLPNPKKPGMPSQAAIATGKDQAYGTSAPVAQAPGDEKMPLMKSLSKQRFGTDVFKDKTAGWKAGDIVDVGFLRGFKALQKKPNGWVVSRAGKKYMVIGGMLYPMEHDVA
jgi:hypothetical protein